MASPPSQKPPWLKIRPPSGEAYHALKARARRLKLATVCEEAQCPNIGECWAEGTATFMLMGDVCTRGCRFCDINTGNPQGWLDNDEPENIARAIAEAGWTYVVLTSVDRDDIPDGGASHFARCVTRIRELNPEVMLEVLIPDFQGEYEPLKTVVDSGPEVVAQNVETVERLTHLVRDRRAGYQQTLTQLARIKEIDSTRFTKSSIMLGLGETEEEVYQCLYDLRRHGVDIVTLGQYLQPSKKHLAVDSFIRPEVFEAWRKIAEEDLGFLYCASGPLVRSSYRAGEFFMKRILQEQRNGQWNRDAHTLPTSESLPTSVLLPSQQISIETATELLNVLGDGPISNQPLVTQEGIPHGE